MRQPARQRSRGKSHGAQTFRRTEADRHRLPTQPFHRHHRTGRGQDQITDPQLFDGDLARRRRDQAAREKADRGAGRDEVFGFISRDRAGAGDNRAKIEIGEVIGDVVIADRSPGIFKDA